MQILQRYLRALGDFELSEVAALTEGASGADLREIVRRAVLEHGSAVTVGDLAMRCAPAAGGRRSRQVSISERATHAARLPPGEARAAVSGRAIRRLGTSSGSAR